MENIIWKRGIELKEICELFLKSIFTDYFVYEMMAAAWTDPQCILFFGSAVLAILLIAVR